MVGDQEPPGKKRLCPGLVLSEKEGEKGGKTFAGYIIRLDGKYKGNDSQVPT